MLDIKLLNKIKPGDEVIYEDCFLDIKTEVQGIVEEVAVRSGYDKDGNIDLDDYIIVRDDAGYQDEVAYDHIKDIKFKK